jgi:ribosomal protein S18 acetylase RimI-like enzyme
MIGRVDQPSSELPAYQLRSGAPQDRRRLVQTLQAAYREMGAPALAHLAETVEQHLTAATPLWWVDLATHLPGSDGPDQQPIGCLWLGVAVDQWTGQRQAYIFLVYVAPAHRRRGIGTALITQAQDWAKAQGYRHIGLQVFETNQAALQLYERLGYQPHARWLSREL